MAIVAVVYYSGFGHTKIQAKAVYRGAASVNGIEAKLYTTDEATTKLDEGGCDHFRFTDLHGQHVGGNEKIHRSGG
jgi:multimeric flavodoxin WrbA